MQVASFYKIFVKIDLIKLYFGKFCYCVTMIYNLLK